MSFLEQLKAKKTQLKETETTVTTADGQRFLEIGNTKKSLEPNKFGFIVDTKPDDIPVLVLDNLYIGSQDCAVANVLKDFNIKHVLSIGISLDIEVDTKFVECLDLPETDIKPVLKHCLPYIRSAIEKKENILIHCNAGVSRTSMVAIAYLMQYENMTFEEAYSLVKERRSAIQPNAGFRRQLKCLEPGRVIE